MATIRIECNEDPLPYTPTKEMYSIVAKYIDVMVKQVCRAGWRYENKLTSQDETSLFSLDYLKLAHDNPRIYVQQMLKYPEESQQGIRVIEDQMDPIIPDITFSKEDYQVIQSFVGRVYSRIPKNHLHYLDFHHYMYFVYREFTKPGNVSSGNTVPREFLSAMKVHEIVLRNDDPSQFILRVFLILREYCVFAENNYVKSSSFGSLGTFFKYYETLLIAAKTLAPVFSEFEDELQKHYNLCWIDFNTVMFLRYFNSLRVRQKLNFVLNTRKCNADSPYLVPLITDLRKLWDVITLKVNKARASYRLPEGSSGYIKDRQLVNSYKKLLMLNIWIQRSDQVKNALDLTRLDHQLFDLINDQSFSPSGPILNKKGECICEDCLVSKFSEFIETTNYNIINLNCRSVYCRKCNYSIDLDFHAHHYGMHIDDMKLLLKKRDPPVPSRPIKSKCYEFVRMIRNAKSLAEIYLNKSDAAPCEAAEEVPQIETKHTEENMESKNTKNNRAHRGHNKQSKRPSAATIEKLALNTTRLMEQEKLELLKKSEEKTPPPKNKKSKKKRPRSSSRSKRGKSKLKNRVQSNAPERVQQNVEATEGSKVAQPQPKVEVKAKEQKTTKTVTPTQQQPGTVQAQNKKKKSGNQKMENKVKHNEVPETQVQQVAESSNQAGTKAAEIGCLVAYIEGSNQALSADAKKADKKKRQKLKKEMEEKAIREKEMEEEEAAERKLEQEAILKEAFRQKHMFEEMEKARKEAERRSMLPGPILIDTSESKKKKKKQRQQAEKLASNAPHVMEETIPAIVTIKRVQNPEDTEPSVSITLKGYTADQDKLLTSLILDSRHKNLNNSSSKKTGTKIKTQITSNYERVEIIESNESQIIAKDFKVTLILDRKPVLMTDTLSTVFEKQCKINSDELIGMERPESDEEIQSLGDLKLPPGITITKVDGPLSNKNYVNDSERNAIGNSGVIVVDTEQLLHKSSEVGTGAIKREKVEKKKPKQKKPSHKIEATVGKSNDASKMITLRNPMFQQFQNPNTNPSPRHFANNDESTPASIFTNENGMVTIRSSRIQQNLQKGFGGLVPPSVGVIPSFLAEMATNNAPNQYTVETNLNNGFENVSSLNAQEILSGLPGIEITKIDRKNDKSMVNDNCQGAEVSIIPSCSNGSNSQDLNNDDWIYDSIFKPKEVLDDDMDDDDLEVEAFKRFCQQSIPPREKKRVKLNVADIVVQRKPRPDSDLL